MKTSDTKNKKRFIEDSPDVREAIADLQAKASPEAKKKIVLREEHITDDSFSDGVDTIGDEVLEETADSESVLQHNYTEEFTEDALEDYYEEAYMSEHQKAIVAAGKKKKQKSVSAPAEETEETEAVEEDIAGDTFEEVMDETVTKGTIGDVVRENTRERKRQQEMQQEELAQARAAAKKKREGKVKKKKVDDNVIISMEGVTKAYVKGVPALNDVNIKIRKGEFVFIVGDSGSGKSTLIKLLLRELKPTEGSIWVNGFQVDRLRHGKIPKLRRSMGVVFQDFRLLPDMNVYENVAFAQRIVQTPVRQMKRNVPSMLAMVGLAGKYKAKPHELSGGEQQRVALARALVNQPPILLADEPTGNLDVKNTNEIMSLLEKINENGTTVIVVTHNDKIVNDMKKRVITIKKGVIVSDEEMGGYIYED